MKWRRGNKPKKEKYQPGDAVLVWFSNEWRAATFARRGVAFPSGKWRSKPPLTYWCRVDPYGSMPFKPTEVKKVKKAK